MSGKAELSFGNWAFLATWLPHSPSPKGDMLRDEEERAKHLALLRKVRGIVEDAKAQGVTAVAVPLTEDERLDLMWGLDQIDWTLQGLEQWWEIKQALGWTPPEIEED